jgi:hypothetical protein
MKLFFILIAIGLLLIVTGAIVTTKYQSCLSDVISFPIIRDCIPDIAIQIAGISILVGIACIPTAFYFLEKKDTPNYITEK